MVQPAETERSQSGNAMKQRLTEMPRLPRSKTKLRLRGCCDLCLLPLPTNWRKGESTPGSAQDLARPRVARWLSW